jgi:hypothetical protein
MLTVVYNFFLCTRRNEFNYERAWFGNFPCFRFNRQPFSVVVPLDSRLNRIWKDDFTFSWG